MRKPHSVQDTPVALKFQSCQCNTCRLRYPPDYVLNHPGPLIDEIQAVCSVGRFQALTYQTEHYQRILLNRYSQRLRHCLNLHPYNGLEGDRVFQQR